jgi:hypothetical protein
MGSLELGAIESGPYEMLDTRGLGGVDQQFSLRDFAFYTNTRLPNYQKGGPFK